MALEEPLKIYNNIYTEFKDQTAPGKIVQVNSLVSMRIILTQLKQPIPVVGFRNKKYGLLSHYKLITRAFIWLNGFAPLQAICFHTYIWRNS